MCVYVYVYIYIYRCVGWKGSAVDNSSFHLFNSKSNFNVEFSMLNHLNSMLHSHLSSWQEMRECSCMHTFPSSWPSPSSSSSSPWSWQLVATLWLVTLLQETHEVPSVREALTASAMKKKKIEQQASTQGQQLWMPLRWEPKISLKQKGGPVSHQML